MLPSPGAAPAASGPFAILSHPLSQRLSKSYKAFTAREWPAAEAPGSGIGQFLAGLTDANLTILIRALLDAQTRTGAIAPGAVAALPGAHPAPGTVAAAGSAVPLAGMAPAGGTAGAPVLAAPAEADAGADADADAAEGLSAGPAAFAFARERLESLREESAVKFLEFRERWRKRLAFPQLHPFLQRNQWFARAEDGWVLAGKGTRKDAKMLYLQSLHDMASDAERQVSFLSGHLFRQEGEVAALWHRESVRDNRSRLLPALEAALRNGESALFKRLRLSLGDLAQETFTERVGKWERRLHADEADLFRQAAWPWLGAGHASGFEGFMETFADLCEALCAAMLDHYDAKWGLYLRGLALERG